MLNNILIYQDEYLTLLEEFLKNLKEESELVDYLAFFEKINIFWMKRIETIEKELALITKTNECILLSGSLYLDFGNSEHYQYFTFGTFHLLHDSLLKIESFFRLPNAQKNIQSTIPLFIKIINIEMKILTEYRGIFLILPLELMYSLRVDSRIEDLDHTFWNIISSIFEKEYTSKDQFLEDFKTFEEIAKAIDPKILKHIIFSTTQDSKKTLRNRIQDYLKQQKGLEEHYKQFPEPEIFLSVLFGNIVQVLEIIDLSQFFNVKPYIRYDITFHYFMILTEPFSNDPSLKDLIQDVYIFFVFHHAFDPEKVRNTKFSDYVQRTKQKDYYELVRAQIKNTGIADLSIKNIHHLLKNVIDLDVFF